MVIVLWSFIAVLLLAGVVVARPFAGQRWRLKATRSRSSSAPSPTAAPRHRSQGVRFVLKVAGRERAIVSCSCSSLARPTPSRIAPPFATNVPPPSGIHDTMIVIDDQSIVPGDETRLGPAIDLYMAGLGRSARVGLVTVQDRGLGVALTTDRDAIRAGVKAMVGRAPRPSRPRTRRAARGVCSTRCASSRPVFLRAVRPRASCSSRRA